MVENEFLFTPGLWLGEGKISFRASPEFLKFYTKWEIKEANSNLILATQVVEILGIEEQLVNQYTIKEIQAASFQVKLENNIVGSVTGKGLRNDNVIAWEFKGQNEFEGFEVYEQQETGDYFFHGEFGASEQFRTLIEGLVWRKGN